MMDLRLKTPCLLWQQHPHQNLITMVLISPLTEAEVEVTSTIEVVEEVEHTMDHLNSLPSISFNKHNLIPMELSQKGQSVSFVERLVTWPLIVTIEWIMLTKVSIHQPSSLPWSLHPMHISLKISPGLLIVLQQIMSLLALTISAFPSRIKVKIKSLLAMDKISLSLI